jgi:DNA-directed RNA polymerase specialized sigma24 family protein
MANSFFDLDISFGDETEPDLSKIPAEDLKAAIDDLPPALRDVAMGLLYEKRTMSDVSQALGIRQGELVTRLHRAQLAIGMSLMDQAAKRHQRD